MVAALEGLNPTNQAQQPEVLQDLSEQEQTLREAYDQRLNTLIPERQTSPDAAINAASLELALMGTKMEIARLVDEYCKEQDITRDPEDNSITSALNTLNDNSDSIVAAVRTMAESLSDKIENASEVLIGIVSQALSSQAKDVGDEAEPSVNGAASVNGGDSSEEPTQAMTVSPPAVETSVPSQEIER